jgi:peptide-methionine (S)-S-oxide reductase
MRIAWITAALLLVAAGCWMVQQRDRSPSAAGSTAVPATMPAEPAGSGYRQATFAAGCFWGVQSAFDKVPGVVSTEVGYSGGTLANPTYEQVCTHTTGHAESVLVTYDPSKISYAKLLDIFWTCHDPTTVNSQGPDIGSNYRSIIFYHDAEQERLARASLKEVSDAGFFKDPIATEIIPAAPFYPAEEYHQHYFAKMGNGEFCHVGPVKVHTELATKAEAARQSAINQPPATQPAE